ncbi:amidase [Bordetella tumulicola]
MTQLACSDSYLAQCVARTRQHREAAALALTHVDMAGAWAQAATLAERLSAGEKPGPLAGLTCTIKACFDVKGWTTHAGSAALLAAPPAQEDATLVSRLRQSGALIFAQTNMTEFAYGALGVNTHFGTPRTPLCVDDEHVAGGSSSGAAVSVALGFADLALCSDTSGSARIPAAFCGVVGMMPTAGHFDTQGMLGLSPSFDVPGVIARSVSVCTRAYEALRNKPHECTAGVDPIPERAELLSLCVPEWVFHADVDSDVLELFHCAIERLRAQGIKVSRREVAAIADVGAISAEGGLIAADAYALHRDLLVLYGDHYEPLVRRRIEAGAQVPAWKYGEAQRVLALRAMQYEAALQEFDAMLTPTSPIFPPRLSTLQDEGQYLALNKKSFAFTEIANRLGKPSISIPLGDLSDRPAALLLTGKAGQDASLLGVASLLERTLSPHHTEGVINDSH